MHPHSLALSYLAEVLANEPDGPEAAMLSDEVYALLRLCLLKRDQRALRAHPDTAHRLYRVVMARYRSMDGYGGTQHGHRFVDGPVIGAVARTLCGDTPTP